MDDTIFDRDLHFRGESAFHLPFGAFDVHVRAIDRHVHTRRVLITGMRPILDTVITSCGSSLVPGKQIVQPASVRELPYQTLQRTSPPTPSWRAR